MVRGLVKKRNILTILVGGGNSCQGNTPLNKGRKGLANPRSQQPKQLVRTRDELKTAFPNVTVPTFLENVASSPEGVKQEYDLLMGAKPVSINAGIFGLVDRKRLCWAADPHGEDNGVEQPSSPRERHHGVGERSVGHLLHGEAHPASHPDERRLYTPGRTRSQNRSYAMVAKVPRPPSRGSSITPTMATASRGR